MTQQLHYWDYTLRTLKHQFKRTYGTPILMAVLFTIAKHWKQPKCLFVNEQIKKLWYIYTMEFYAAERKKELLPSVTAWMELESIVSEIKQSVKGTYFIISPLSGM